MTADGQGHDAGHESLRMLMGAFVLGGLDSADRSAFERHLAGCASCRAELSRLVPVPGLLQRRAPERADVAPPAVVPLEPLLGGVRAERARAQRRLRALVLGVAAATLAAAAAGTALVLGDDADPGPGGGPPAAQPSGRPSADPAPVVPPDRTQPLRPGDGVTTAGRADLTGKPWGTAVTATVADLTGDGPYVLVVLGAGSRTEQAATWSATPAGKATVAGATSLPPGQIVAVEVRDVDGRVLATTAG